MVFAFINFVSGIIIVYTPNKCPVFWQVIIVIKLRKICASRQTTLLLTNAGSNATVSQELDKICLIAEQTRNYYEANEAIASSSTT